MPEPDATTDPDEEPLGYAEALAELEAILDELEDDSLDVDLLATRVARAAELIVLCRDRIDGARLEVERIVGAFDEPTPD